MKTADLMGVYHALSDTEKVPILMRALQIKRKHHTIEECILLSSGYYRDIANIGEWLRDEGDRK